MIGSRGCAPWSDPTRGGAAVTFNEILSQTIAMLHQHGRVSYRALKRQFALADDVLADLTYELTEVQQLAVDQDGTVLVLTGEARVAAAPLSPKKVPPPGPVTPPWRCRRLCAATRKRSAAPMGWRCRPAWGSTPAKSWCGPLVTTCIWTTQPWARPPTWPHVWSSSRHL